MPQRRETAKTVPRGQISSSQLRRITFGFHSDQLFNGVLMASISRALWAKAYLSPSPLPDGQIAVQKSKVTCIFKSIQERQRVTFNSWLHYRNAVLLMYVRARCADWYERCDFGLKPPSFYKLCAIIRNLCKIQSTVCSLLPVLHSPFITETSVRSALAKGSSEFPL